jgi:membrane protein implicated in regulation of membrane protease activity
MHLFIFIFLLPLIGLIVFWLLPLSSAIPVYLVILLVSGVLYWVTARAMRKRAKYDLTSLIGTEARVVSMSGIRGNIQYVVEVHGELWNARSRDELLPDDTVKILSADGLTLQVGKSRKAYPSAEE